MLLKYNRGTTVRLSFQRVLKTRTSEKLGMYKDTEFYEKEVKKLLWDHGAELYSTENEEKSSVVEQ